MANDKIKFITYDLLDEYGLLDPAHLDSYLNSLTVEDVNQIHSRLQGWYQCYQDLIIKSSESGNPLFNISPKTFYKFPLAGNEVFTVSTIYPFLPFSNRIYISDPILDAIYFSIQGNKLNLALFKQNIKIINKQIITLRQFVDENLVIFYDIYNLNTKNFFKDETTVKTITSDDFIDYLLPIYKEDPTLLPKIDFGISATSTDGKTKNREKGSMVIAIEGRKIILQHHLSNALRGIVAKNTFNSQYSSDVRADLVVAKKILEFIKDDKTTLVDELIPLIPKLDSFAKGTLPPEEILNIRETEHDVVTVFQNALTELFKKMPEGLSLDAYNRLIKKEMEPQISKINLEVERIRGKYKSLSKTEVTLSVLCLVGTLYYASVFSQPDVLKALLEIIFAKGLTKNIGELLKNRIKKRDEMEKLKQEDFYLLWYSRDISKT